MRNVSKVNFQNKQLTGVQRRSVDLAEQACKHSRQVMISTVSAEGSLCWEDAKSVHVFVQDWGVIKLVPFGDVVQEIPHHSTLSCV